MKPATAATAGTLAAIGGLHAAWGRGSTFPFRDAEQLADTVSGTQALPDPPACYAVAGLLFTAAGLVAGRRVLPTSVRRLGVAGVALVLAGRGVAGMSGSTHRLVGWETSPRFEAIDRAVYGPLCLALAAGAADSLRSRAQRPAQPAVRR